MFLRQHGESFSNERYGVIFRYLFAVLRLGKLHSFLFGDNEKLLWQVDIGDNKKPLNIAALDKKLKMANDS